jgi:hypothetical protein
MFVCPSGGCPTGATFNPALELGLVPLYEQPAAFKIVRNAPPANTQRIIFQCTSSIFASPGDPTQDQTHRRYRHESTNA